jgi:cytochrome d ubiquinol oxidase subunit I
MILLFAVGVVSGTILSFELGLLWPRFMERFGEVFGFAFLMEGFSFFIEAIFIAIYVYGWDRLSPRVHLLSGVPIVITGLTGSFMVLSVNGWMNHPTGFTLTAAGHVAHVKPLEALFNKYFWHEFVHMYLAGYVVVGFVVAAFYCAAWLRGRRDRYHRTALVVSLTMAALSAPAQVIVGDWAARYVADNQPVKLAAMEGLGHTTKGAPYHIGGWYRDGEVRNGIKIPRLLSILAHHDPNSTVIGLDSVPARDRPPVNVVRMSFVAMVASGTLMALVGVVYLLVWWRRRALPPWRAFYLAVLACAPLSLLALIAGWVTTEVGRQPWIAYGIMRTRDAVTGASGIPVGYATLAATYLGLGAIILWFLRRLARRPVERARA